MERTKGKIAARLGKILLFAALWVFAATDVSAAVNDEFDVNVGGNNELKFVILSEPEAGKNGTVEIGNNYQLYTPIVLEDLIIPETVTYDGEIYTVIGIGEYAFSNSRGFVNDDLIGSLTLPNTLEYIGLGAFSNCRALRGSLTIPDSVKKISNFAFNNCQFDGNLKLGDSLTDIGGYAFYNNNFEGKVIIPENVNKIGNAAFGKCDKLELIFFTKTDSAPDMGGVSSYLFKETDVVVYYPKINPAYDTRRFGISEPERMVEYILSEKILFSENPLRIELTKVNSAQVTVSALDEAGESQETFFTAKSSAPDVLNIPDTLSDYN